MLQLVMDQGIEALGLPGVTGSQDEVSHPGKKKQQYWLIRDATILEK